MAIKLSEEVWAETILQMDEEILDLTEEVERLKQVIENIKYYFDITDEQIEAVQREC